MRIGGRHDGRCEIEVSYGGRFPPDVSCLSALGFDSISSSKSCVVVKKESAGGFVEISLARDVLTVKYGTREGGDTAVQRLHAAFFLAGILSLIPLKMRVDAAQIAAFFLPALETAASMADMKYEKLMKKYSDLKEDCAELSSKSRRLADAAENGARAAAELERQNAALVERVAAFEKFSDAVLADMVLDWLATHRGSFDAVQFAKANGISPQRAEEGLLILERSGTVRKIGSRHQASGMPVRELVLASQAREGFFGRLGNFFGKKQKKI